MHTLLRPLLLSLLGLFLGGCATIVKDDNQPVAFSSDPQGAIIAINGVPRGTTPVTLMIERTRKQQMIEVTKEGYQTTQFPLGKHVAGMTFGNIIFGGIIGLGVDYATGKGANYQNSVTIKLVPLTQTAAAPVQVTESAPPTPPAPAPAATEPAAPRAPSAQMIVTNNGLGLNVAAENGKILVKSVLADSAAAAANIQPGDEIVAYNGSIAEQEAPVVAAAINQPMMKQATVSWRPATGGIKTAKLEW